MNNNLKVPMSPELSVAISKIIETQQFLSQSAFDISGPLHKGMEAFLRSFEETARLIDLSLAGIQTSMKILADYFAKQELISLKAISIDNYDFDKFVEALSNASYDSHEGYVDIEEDAMTECSNIVEFPEQWTFSIGGKKIRIKITHLLAIVGLIISFLTLAHSILDESVSEQAIIKQHIEVNINIIVDSIPHEYLQDDDSAHEDDDLTDDLTLLSEDKTPSP